MTKELAFNLIEQYLHEHEGCIPLHDVCITQEEETDEDGATWNVWTYQGLKKYLTQ